MGKNKRKKERRRKKENRPGTQMQIGGQLKSVSFDVPCSICKKLLDHVPIRVPKPFGWKWDEGEIEYNVFYCCDSQQCVESALNKLRKALNEGIIVDGEPPTALFPKE